MVEGLLPSLRRTVEGELQFAGLGLGRRLGVGPEVSDLDAGSSTLADYYASRLQTFFEGPQNYLKHVLHVGRPLFGLTNDMQSQYRYLNDKEREYAERLLALVEQKDELDFHHALQATLKGWLFVHVPLTYSMIIVAVLHVVLVYAFGAF